MPPDFVTQLVLAAVFTFGGYAILGVRRGGEELASVLGLVLFCCLIVVVALVLAQHVDWLPPDTAQIVRARAP